MSEVNRENMQKWVDALRSGEFEQTRNRLALWHKGEVVGHCCLGVACEVAGVTPVISQAGAVVYDGSSVCLPQTVMDWLGVTSTDPEADYEDGGRDAVSAMNDSHARTFSEIADAIERTYLT